MKVEISENIKYIGVDDKEIDLFESQYIVPNGISYNSYVILDDKIAVMDSVDERFADQWRQAGKGRGTGRGSDHRAAAQ